MLTYSIGEMIDKLGVVHLKIWHLEEQIAKAEEEEWPAEKTEALFDRVVNLNKYRMKIVAAIDKFFDTKG